MKLFKLAAIFFVTILILIISIILYDLAYYDPSYINRNSITFSINNLNSTKVKKLFLHSKKLYFHLGYKISKKQKEFWRSQNI